MLVKCSTKLHTKLHKHVVPAFIYIPPEVYIYHESEYDFSIRINSLARYEVVEYIYFYIYIFSIIETSSLYVWYCTSE